MSSILSCNTENVTSEVVQIILREEIIKNKNHNIILFLLESLMEGYSNLKIFRLYYFLLINTYIENFEVNFLKMAG